MTEMAETTAPKSPSHFKGKDAIGHVAEAQAQGKIAATEIHGLETPGYISAAADAARETAIILVLGAVLSAFFFNHSNLFFMFSYIAFVCGWALWKGGRSAWLGWFRLERLRRVLKQEKWEIKHHRQRERSELAVLYVAKGFEGKLLEEVLDVLVAEDDRFLRVMVEEELGLSLATYEHPLKQGLGAFLGVILAAAISYGIVFAFLFLTDHYNIRSDTVDLLCLLSGPLIIIGLSSAVQAHHAQNRWIPAIVWNIGLAALSFGCVYFFFRILFISHN
jgi:hypothetical protein